MVWYQQYLYVALFFFFLVYLFIAAGCFSVSATWLCKFLEDKDCGVGDEALQTPVLGSTVGTWFSMKHLVFPGEIY